VCHKPEAVDAAQRLRELERPDTQVWFAERGEARASVAVRYTARAGAGLAAGCHEPGENSKFAILGR